MAVQVCKIFELAQSLTSDQDVLVRNLKKCFPKMEVVEFSAIFIKCLKVCLVHMDKDPGVEKTIEFAIQFCVTFVENSDSEEETKREEQFLVAVFKFLLSSHNTAEQSIRYRVCQFLGRLLNKMGQEAFLDDIVCDAIISAMLYRLQDKSPMVRCQAALALQRLQVPNDAGCSIIKAFQFHLSYDPSPDVRRNIVTVIAITPKTLVSMLERTYDIKDSVRRDTYIILSKLSVQRFTIKQRQDLLKNGLNDRAVSVQSVVKKVFIPQWFQNFKEDYLKFLFALDVEDCADCCLQTLRVLFKRQEKGSLVSTLKALQGQDKLVPHKDMTPPVAILWRALVYYLHDSDSDENEDEEISIVPDLTPFTRYIRLNYLVENGYPTDEAPWQALQRQFTLIQLLEITKVYDLSDEMGRSELKQLCVDLLESDDIMDGSVPVIAEIMAKVVVHMGSRMTLLAEIISDIREPRDAIAPNTSPINKPSKRERLEAEKSKLEEEYDAATEVGDLPKATAVHTKMDNVKKMLEGIADGNGAWLLGDDEECEMRSDRKTLTKCLTIVIEFLQVQEVKYISPTLRSLLQNFVLQSFENPYKDVRNLVITALGSFCALEEDLAKSHIMWICLRIGNDDESLTALKVTFDLLLKFGLATFGFDDQLDESFLKLKKSRYKGRRQLLALQGDSDTEESPPTSPDNSNANSSQQEIRPGLLSLIASLLDSSNPSLRNTTAEGFCKLLFNGRISCPSLLAKLLIKWFSSDTELDPHFRQPVGIFFRMFSTSTPGAMAMLEEAFLLTLRTLATAPLTSQLAEIDLDAVARLLLHLTKPTTTQTELQELSVHDRLAKAICEEILAGTLIPTALLLRSASLTELSLVSTHLQELIDLINVVRKKIASKGDKASQKICLKFLSIVESKYRDAVAMKCSQIENTQPNEESSVSRHQEISPEEEPRSLCNGESEDKIMLKSINYGCGLVIPGTPDSSESSADEEKDDVSAHENGNDNTIRSLRKRVANVSVVNPVPKPKRTQTGTSSNTAPERETPTAKRNALKANIPALRSSVRKQRFK